MQGTLQSTPSGVGDWKEPKTAQNFVCVWRSHASDLTFGSQLTNLTWPLLLQVLGSMKSLTTDIKWSTKNMITPCVHSGLCFVCVTFYWLNTSCCFFPIAQQHGLIQNYSEVVHKMAALMQTKHILSFTLLYLPKLCNIPLQNSLPRFSPSNVYHSTVTFWMFTKRHLWTWQSTETLWSSMHFWLLHRH